MLCTVLECQVSKMVNSDACPRPTTGDIDAFQVYFHEQEHSSLPQLIPYAAKEYNCDHFGKHLNILLVCWRIYQEMPCVPKWFGVPSV
jgi:hypothetical protein